MKYQVYRIKVSSAEQAYLGAVMDSNGEMIADFWFPDSKMFRRVGLFWETGNCITCRQKDGYYRGGELVREFDSVRDIKQWLLEKYFEHFL